MADNQGWISIHRSIRDHWVFKDERVFSKYEAWLDLLMDANHQDKKILFDGSLITVKRGDRITSIRQLSEQWGWSRSKVTRFLNMLEDDSMITKKSDTKKTVVTIVNYDKYQNQDLEKRQQRATVEPQTSHGRATDEPQTNTNNNELIMTNNDNNVNKVNKEFTNTPFPAELIQKLYGKFPTGILQGAIAGWLQVWPREMICFAIQISFDYGKEMEVLKPYVSRILDNWSSAGIDTLEKATEARDRFKHKNSRASKVSGFKQPIRKEPIPEWTENEQEQEKPIDPKIQRELEERLKKYAAGGNENE